LRRFVTAMPPAKVTAAAGRCAEALAVVSRQPAVPTFRTELPTPCGHHHRHRARRPADVGVSFGHRQRAVLVDVGPAALDSPPACASSPKRLPRPWLGPSGTLSFGCAFGGLDGLHLADVFPSRAVRRLVPSLSAVDLAHSERVDAEFASQLVDASSTATSNRCAGARNPHPLGFCRPRSRSPRRSQIVYRKSADAALLNRPSREGSRLYLYHFLSQRVRHPFCRRA